MFQILHEPLTFTLSFPSGLGPSLSSRLGGLHHQPVQRHPHTCDVILATIFLTRVEEEAAAQRSASRVSVELKGDMDHKMNLFLSYFVKF